MHETVEIELHIETEKVGPCGRCRSLISGSPAPCSEN